ncbi:MAG: J domain-containing protein [Eubacteriales bacterium]|nr:J domain-containing protein [Eubacteriales bacterium]
MLTKEESYNILGLKQGANSYEIESRYTLLMKRFRGKQDEKSLMEMEQIFTAYDVLMDRYVEPVPIDPRLEQVVFGKTRYQWRNIWHYKKIPLLISIIVLFFVGSLIYTMVTNEDPDFQIVVSGLFTQSAETDQLVESYLQTALDSVETVQFQIIPITFEEQETEETDMMGGGADEQLRVGYVMKMVTVVSVDSIELFICEKSTYNQYAPQGAFRDMTALYERLSDLPESIYNQIKPLRRDIIRSSDDLSDAEKKALQSDDQNDDESLPITGLEVTGLNVIETFDLEGPDQILAVGHKADDPEMVESFIEYLIRDRAGQMQG